MPWHRYGRNYRRISYMETAYERFWVSIVIVYFVNVIVMQEIVFCSMSWVKMYTRYNMEDL